MRLALAFILILSSIQTYAGLISLGPDRSTTLDTHTQLVWLDLDQTLGYSINDILSGAGGYIDDGWSVAYGSLVDELFKNAGFTRSGVLNLSNDPRDVEAYNLLMDTLGATSSYPSPFDPSVIIQMGWGFALKDPDYIPSLPDAASALWFSNLVNYEVGWHTSAFIGTNGELTRDSKFSDWGVYLYRPVSVLEPGTFGLLAIGLGALGFIKRKQQA